MVVSTRDRNSGTRTSGLNLLPKTVGLCTLVSLLGVARLSAQPPAKQPDSHRTEGYTEASWAQKEGLAGPVWAISQDDDGYLWLGTDEGLIRFDGQSFVSIEPPNGPALPSTEARMVVTSPERTLWVGFGGTALVSRIRGGHITTYTAQDGLPDGSVLALIRDRKGTIWAGGHGGLASFTGSRWQHQPIGQQDPRPTVEALYEGHDGTLWAGTSAGIFRKGDGAASFERVQSTAPLVHSFAEDSFGIVFSDPRRGVRGLNERDPLGTRSTSSLPVPGWRVLYDRTGNLWIGTLGKGLFRARAAGPFRSGTPEFEQFTTRNGMAGDVVRCLFEDVEGNVWAGTTNGLTRFSGRQVVPVSGPGMSTTELIRATAIADDRSVWAVTPLRLIHYTLGGQQVQQYPLESSNTTIMGLYGSREHGLWLATDEGLARYEKGHISHVTPSQTIQLNRISAITVAADENIWLCDYDKGIFRWTRQALRPVDVDPSLRGKVCTCAYTGNNGDVWIGFATGQVLLNRHNRSLIYSDANGLARGRVTSIYQDRRGVTWVSTATGLSRFDTETFSTWTVDSGLPGKAVFAVLDDRQGFLWLSMSTGLVRIDPHELELNLADRSHRIGYQLYDASDGVRGTPAWMGSPPAVQAGDGTLWFVTTTGMSMVDPRMSSERRSPPAVRIERVEVNDREFDPSQVAKFDPLVSKLEVRYTAFHFAAPSKLRFRYMLEGFDHSWVNGGTSRLASYTNLPPGPYRFHVIAAVDDSWNGRDEIWAFSIAPTLYQRVWFWYLCGAALIAGAWVLWQIRLRHVERQFRLVLAERSRMSGELHDTLLQSLVGVALQLDNLSSEMTDAPRTVRDQLNHLSRQVGHYVGEARRSILDLRSPAPERRDFNKALTQVGGAIVGDSIRYEVSVSGEPDCPSQVQHQLVRIAQEAVSNAVRHGRPREIRVQLLHDANTIVLRVSDDGSGFVVAEAGQSAVNHWGLAIMRERAEQVGGRFSIVSVLDQGTVVEAVVPREPN